MNHGPTPATPRARARPLRLHAADPGPALEAAFERIERESMAGLALLNPALRVQAVGFARWQGQWLGALVTPWFVNLVLVPGQAEGWVSLEEGARRFLRFGAGDFGFLGGHEVELGEFQSCSLISPPGDFTHQDDAVACAQIALRLLHEPAPAAENTCASPLLASAIEPPCPVPPPAPQRRVFLFGRAA